MYSHAGLERPFHLPFSVNTLHATSNETIIQLFTLFNIFIKYVR